MYNESEFIPIINEEDWLEGLDENIIYKDGISLCQKKIYSIKSVIDLNENNLIGEVKTFFTHGLGVVYLVNDKGELWEYDTAKRSGEILYSIEEFQYIVDFIIKNNKLYCLCKKEYYYLAIFSLSTCQFVKEINSGIKSIKAYHVDYSGVCYLLDEKNNVNIIKETGDIIKLKTNEIIYEKQVENRFIMSSFSEENLVICNSITGRLQVLEIEKINNIDAANCVKSEKYIKNVSNIFFDNRGILYVSYYEDKQYFIDCSYDLINFDTICYSKVLGDKISFDSRGKLFIKNKDNTLFVLNKELKINSSKYFKKHTGIYFTKILDSHHEDMNWHKIILNRKIPKDTQIKVSYFSTNDKKTFYKSEELNIDVFLKSDNISYEDKAEFVKDNFIGEIVNPRQALLLNCKGRYLIIKIELNGTETVSPIIESMRIYYNKSSYVRYLPEIYQNNSQGDDFLERYLSIFEALYVSVEEKIEYISNYFDVDKAEYKFLKWLCKWIGLDVYENWQEDKLRELLRNAHFILRKKGTKSAIEKVLNIYLGQKPIIIENYRIHEMDENSQLKKIITDLYGDSRYSFTVLLTCVNELSLEEQENIEKILENESPAFCKYSFIVLKPLLFLDKHSYLGINSCITGYSSLKLDNNSILPYNSIILDEIKENIIEGYTRLGVNGYLE